MTDVSFLDMFKLILFVCVRYVAVRCSVSSWDNNISCRVQIQISISRFLSRVDVDVVGFLFGRKFLNKIFCKYLGVHHV